MKLAAGLVQDASSEPRPGVLVFEAGKITGMAGTTTEARARTGFAVPGFIDSHTHPLETGLELLFTSLLGSRSIPEVLERLQTRRADAGNRGTLLGFNLDPEALVERRYPTRNELDMVTRDVPALIYRVDGHSAVVNSPGLALISGIDALGFEMGEDGNPTGVLRGPMYERASRLFKRRLQPDQIRAALRLAGELAVSKGVTTIGAMVGNEDLTQPEWTVMLDALAGSAVAAVPFIQTWEHDTAVSFGLKRIGGCLLIDGSLGSHTAALSDDYADASGNRGMAYVPDDRLLAFFKRADELEMQTTVHAIGDRAVEQVVRCHEQLGTAGSGNRWRHRIEHAELLDDALIERISRQRLVLGVQPAFEAHWGGPDRMYCRRLGNRWQRTNPFRRLLEQGVVLAGGSDSPITPISPLAGIKAAIEHPNSEQRVSPDQALAMFTTGAAYSFGLEHRIGRLEAGMDADFTVLTDDPRTSQNCEVAATFRSGRCVYRDERLADYLHEEA